ncbi:translation elongation factor 2 (EF-2/EF-G) [Chthoniobacter flavus]|uniref:elongation factor G n=1 Tax=Chthoniobacter flavus TaxID=191863 RepID=UPI00104A6788|nr:elongation factor G [Chthoniobacter flavus]TCO87393.1 translation elongation factor 2 (EF-2/EF-G) [Chthoniobacter flavus]
MNTQRTADLRNFAIVGHASAGKTMLAEAMLMCSGVIGRMGSVANGTTVSDYHVSEKQHQISTQASLLHTEWQGKKFNIIDTPGYLDFLSESLAALNAVDFAVVVVHAQHGIGVGTERVWKCATDRGIPKILVVNAMDKPNTRFDEVLAAAREHFGHRVFPLNVPANPGPGFNQILDVLRSDLVTYDATGRGKFREDPAVGPRKERVTQLHRELIELIAESDDTLLAKFFDEGGLSEEELRAGIHAAFQRQLFIPLFCISAETDIGVARLLDFIAKYGSSPRDRRVVAAHNGSDGAIEVPLDGPDPVVQVFKTMAEEHFGEMSFFRVYSGNISTGMELWNSQRNLTERIGQIYLLNGHDRAAVGSLQAGDIGAVVKLKDTHTGNTLCAASHPVTLPTTEYPKPVIHAALKTKAKGEEDRVAAGLATLHDEDPAFQFHVDPELHQTVVSAQGELHLEVVVERLRRRFNVHVDLAEPRVAFRETIKVPAEATYRHKKQTGGAGQFAEVALRIAPGPRDSGITFTESLSGQAVDRVYVPSVERGVQHACTEGIIAGFRAVDVTVDFHDGKMHPVDSNDISFQVAGYWAFKEAFAKAKPCLLEPIHKIEVRIPEECVGKVMGDLSSRRGNILGVDVDGVFQVIRAQVPAKELYRYSSQLRSLTGGRGLHSEEFSHYAEMPHELEQRMLEEAKRKRGGK